MNSVFDSLGIMCPMDTECICGSDYLVDNDDQNYYLTLPMAGVDKNEIHVESKDGRRISITYEKNSKDCIRTFVLPETINIDKSEAEILHGMLHLTLPIDKPKASQISIK